MATKEDILEQIVDEVDEWVRSGGAADKTDKPDTEQ